MIPPREQWAIQIDVTNQCFRACANCTRFVGHHAEPFWMTPDQFRRACEALVDFPTDSPPTQRVANKVVGMIGGEPLMHPQFDELCWIMASVIPERKHRGLWTGLDWTKHRAVKLIKSCFGYINNNRHDRECRHSPILIGIQDVVKDAKERRRLIDACWLEEKWSGTITPRGFFFCEVAGAMDLLFDGPGGLPVEPGCWRRPLKDFKTQIETWCPRCGVPLNLRGRLDREEVDDVSQTNLDALKDSPRILQKQYVLYTGDGKTDPQPWQYLK